MRRRSLWEAADSGILLWRKNFFYFIPPFALPLWAAACALRLLPDNLPVLSYLILWWLKPLFDRPLLHVVSRCFFEAPGQSPGVLYKGLAASLFPFLPGDLLWRRFSPRRGVTMPIRILEGLKGEEYRRRKAFLAPGGLGFCGILTFLGLLLELVLFSGETSFFLMIANFIRPGFLRGLYGALQKIELLFFIIYCFNYLLTESLYVCMGFGLYVNCRVETEGWDIQILFRRFAEGGGKAGDRGPGRRDRGSREGEERRRRVLGSSGMLLLPLLLWGGVFRGAFAEEAPREGDAAEFFMQDRGAPLELLDEILASPDFGGEREGWGIRLKERGEETAAPGMDFSSLFGGLKRFFAIFLRTLAVLLVLSLLVFAVLMYIRRRKKAAFPGEGGNSFSLAAPLQGDPEGFFLRARALQGEGLFRESWANLFSGVIAAFSLRRGLDLPQGATEYGCLALVRSAFPEEQPGFEGLIRRWIGLAYGGILPGEGAFEEALAYGEALARGRAAGDRATGSRDGGGRLDA
jgi:hypothetical protein